jgi:hypothetical protein
MNGNGMADGGNDDSGNDQSMQRNTGVMKTLFIAVVALNVASFVWYALRENSMQPLRVALDAIFQLAIAGSIGALTFRALCIFPFQLTDLFGMVIVLAAWSKVVVDSLAVMKQSGLMVASGDGEVFVQTLQVTLWSASILVAGGALGLWFCSRLRIQRPLPRLLKIVPAMLALPAATGCVAFVPYALAEMFDENGSHKRAAVVMLLWFVSLLITLANTFNYVRASALLAEVGKDS